MAMTVFDKIDEILGYLDGKGITDDEEVILSEKLTLPEELRFLALALEVYDLDPSAFMAIFQPADGDGDATWSDTLREAADALENAWSR